MLHGLFAITAFAAAAVSGGQPEPLGYGWALLKMMLALAVVCVGAYLLLRYGLRRLAVPSSLVGRNMRPIERCPLTAGRSLWLIKVGGRYLVIGEAEGSITNLGEVAEDEVKLERAAGAPGRFAELLKRRATAKGRRGGEEDAAT